MQFAFREWLVLISSETLIVSQTAHVCIVCVFVYVVSTHVLPNIFISKVTQCQSYMSNMWNKDASFHHNYKKQQELLLIDEDVEGSFY